MLELHQGTLLVTRSLSLMTLVSPLRLIQVDEDIVIKAMPTTSCTGHLDVVFTTELPTKERSPCCHTRFNKGIEFISYVRQDQVHTHMIDL